MKQEAILALIRHGLTVAGGALVTSGMSTESEITTVAGAVVGVIGFAWSLWRKYENKARAS